AFTKMPDRARVLALAGVAAVVCLGRYAGLEPVVDALPPLRAFRYPTKAFFTVHLAVALRCADRLSGGSPARLGRAPAGGGAGGDELVPGRLHPARLQLGGPRRGP